ncbi:MAG TPA: hypothetical protein VMU38_12090, partial [Candidatus Binatia bacterium]|nr:hypothetical protein [Candidatus Binatia bacterium]
ERFRYEPFVLRQPFDYAQPFDSAQGDTVKPFDYAQPFDSAQGDTVKPFDSAQDDKPFDYAQPFDSAQDDTVKPFDYAQGDTVKPFDSAQGDKRSELVPQLRLHEVREVPVQLRGGEPAVVDRQAVRQCAGPWRIAERSHSDCAEGRDEYDVVLESGTFARIYRQGSHWYFRGIYE